MVFTDIWPGEIGRPGRYGHLGHQFLEAICVACYCAPWGLPPASTSFNLHTDPSCRERCQESGSLLIPFPGAAPVGSYFHNGIASTFCNASYYFPIAALPHWRHGWDFHMDSFGDRAWWRGVCASEERLGCHVLRDSTAVVLDDQVKADSRGGAVGRLGAGFTWGVSRARDDGASHHRGRRCWFHQLPSSRKKDWWKNHLTWGGNSVCSRGGQGIRAIGAHREAVKLGRGRGAVRHRVTAEQG